METIRKIDGMPFGIKASINIDTEDTQIIYIQLEVDYEIVMTEWFNIEWCKNDNDRIDNLAYVFGTMMKKAYLRGRRMERIKIVDNLKGLKRLLKLEYPLDDC